MNTRQFLFSLWACLALSVQPSAAQSWAAQAPPYGRPDATIDLRTREGVHDPTTLDARRGNGKVSFNWYRIHVTLPQTVAALSVPGSIVSFEIVIDDYAEIWVNGKLPTVLGESGGSVVKGWNAPNKVVLTRNQAKNLKLRCSDTTAPCLVPQKTLFG